MTSTLGGPLRDEGSAAGELVRVEYAACVPGDDDVGRQDRASVVEGFEGNDGPVGSPVSRVPLGMAVEAAEVMASEGTVRIEVENGTAAVAERLATILGISEAEHVLLLLPPGGSPLPEELLEPPVSVNCDSG